MFFIKNLLYITISMQNLRQIKIKFRRYYSFDGIKMEVLEAIKTRRSIRSFKYKPIPEEDAIKMLDAGRLAPTGGNRQPWTFIYINDPQTLRMVKNCSPGFYGDASAAIVIGVENGRSALNLLDVGFAAENISLAAHALGLGSCAIASFIKDSIKQIVEAPEDWEPILLVSLGYPDKAPNQPPKKPLYEVTYFGSYGKKWEKLEGL